MESGNASSDPAPIPYLPPELMIRIIAESEEERCCLINLLTRGLLKCEGLQDFTTVKYTRGTLKANGKFNRGSIESFLLQHQCVFGNVRGTVKDDAHLAAIPHSHMDELSVELRRWHLIKRDIIFDFAIKENEGVADEVIRLLDSSPYTGALFDILLHSKDALGFLDQDLLNKLPFADSPDPEGGPRLKPNDSLLEYQRIRHMMLRSTELGHDGFWAIATQLARRDQRFANYVDMIASMLNGMETYSIQTMLDLNWSRLTGLDTLCLDLRNWAPIDEFTILRAKFSEMGKHLNLKTLIVLGLPCRARFDDLGEEAWVAKLEDEDYCIPISDLYNDGFKPFALSVLKHCLRPGGQIHFISALTPGASYWPDAGEQDIEALDE
ncbi:hypothetical protein F66182_290 [Fusarium sp. NRRL 66182]|nr:hypothetical protein F66182_290 [Fusarium sp. NRRL 66182]